jgi:hypothetical protein
MKKIIIASTISIIFILLYNVKGPYLGVLGVPFLFMLSYISIFLTMNFYFSKDFFGSWFYFWKKDNDKQNFITLFYSLVIMILISSLLFQLNDSKELGNQYIWGCYIEYAFAGIGFIWIIGLILSFILLVIGLINPILVKFERRDKLFYSLFIINNIALILISIIVISVKLLSYNLHGVTSSCL